MATAHNPVPSQDEIAITAPGFDPGVTTGPDLILLRAAFGQDEANHGTGRYSVKDDGLVQVPLDAVEPLIAVGGFVLAETVVDAISVGALKLHHDTAAGCSYAGRQYLGDANGDVLVPAEATSELLAHGFVPVLEAETGMSVAKIITEQSFHRGLSRWLLEI